MNQKKIDLKWYEILACMWPVGLVVIGGGLGGLCGGLAIALNFQIFQKKISTTKKYVYSILIGLGSVVVYFIAVVILAVLFPSTFA